MTSKCLSRLVAVASLSFASVGASAVPFFWTDWISSTTTQAGAFEATGKITAGTSSVDVTYTNPRGVGFFQDGVSGDLTDYFAQGSFGSLGRIPATSPYTGSLVDNIPPAAEMIALSLAGTQTLTFSEAIANPVFAFVSLNGNGYAFDQDFEILSVGGEDGNDCGFWGCGGITKIIVDLGGGNFQYRLDSTGGEPHGAIRFTGVFDTLTWDSTSDEFWNGFTVGVQGTAVDVCLTNPTLPGCVPPPPPGTAPEPGMFALLGLGLLGLGLARRRKSA